MSLRGELERITRLGRAEQRAKDLKLADKIVEKVIKSAKKEAKKGNTEFRYCHTKPQEHVAVKLASDELANQGLRVFFSKHSIDRNVPVIRVFWDL